MLSRFSNALDKYVLLDKCDFETDIWNPCVWPNPYSSASMMRKFHSNEASSEDKYTHMENLLISPLCFVFRLTINPNLRNI